MIVLLRRWPDQSSAGSDRSQSISKYHIGVHAGLLRLQFVCWQIKMGALGVLVRLATGGKVRNARKTANWLPSEVRKDISFKTITESGPTLPIRLIRRAPTGPTALRAGRRPCE